MQRRTTYESPLGILHLAADEAGLQGLWLEGQKYFASGLHPACLPGELPALNAAKAWLDDYFSGQRMESLPPLHLQGTAFQLQVWHMLCAIPYGETITYGALARQVAQRLGRAHMSAQAVGGAVGHNPVSIIVPCHRVVGADGSLTGYAGGIEKKLALLRLEGAQLAKDHDLR